MIITIRLNCSYDYPICDVEKAYDARRPIGSKAMSMVDFRASFKREKGAHKTLSGPGHPRGHEEASSGAAEKAGQARSRSSHAFS